MAHATVEYTANIEGAFDLDALLALIARHHVSRCGWDRTSASPSGALVK